MLFILLCGFPPFYSKSNRETLEMSAKGQYSMVLSLSLSLTYILSLSFILSISHKRILSPTPSLFLPYSCPHSHFLSLSFSHLFFSLSPFKEGLAWQDISSEAKDLVSRILTVDLARRISTTDILAHPWLRPRHTGA